MSDNLYTYAVARIRSKELTLLNKSVLDQLLASNKYEDCIQILIDKGWGNADSQTLEQLLAYEREKTWSLMGELVDDLSVFDTFLYENDFHNLKAAIKQVYINEEVSEIYITHGTVSPEIIYKSVKEHNFSVLPLFLQTCAEEAYQVQMHTGDSQLCDVIIDKATLETIYVQGKKSGSELLAEYVELKIATADIKIALRGNKTKKNKEFLDRAIVDCDSLDRNKLISCALDSLETIYGYLETTDYSDAVAEMKKSSSAFEKWCDNLIIEKIKPQKYNPFSLSPLAAYILARENEIKSVRILLSGKLNGLSEDSIRERLREMYV
ncbi:MAG: V-type ATP synthase subunit C [Clostridiales bacterium GWF2_36_10]|nr:MAG: V-type ATP synthase subunit C [Clostridiales bacterium GWF2_36_10]HAN21995.1 V-type ATP synthase subunit C [Clostridiales bacterium]